MAGANKAPAFLAFCRHTKKIVSRLQIILSVLLYCKHSLPCKQPCKQPCKCTGKKLISVLAGEKGRSELQELLSIKNRDYFRTDFWISTIFLFLGVCYKKYCTFTIYFKYSVILNLHKVNELNYKTGI